MIDICRTPIDNTEAENVIMKVTTQAIDYALERYKEIPKKYDAVAFNEEQG